MSPLPAPSDPRAPKYWMYETSGVLKPVIEAYLNNRVLTLAQVAVMRAYLRQWIMSPVWDRGADPALYNLRCRIALCRTQSDIRKWLKDALEEGHDPL